MIKKLKSRIFFIIMLSLSLFAVAGIIFLAFSNYKNTINTATLMMDRVTNGGIQKEPNLRPENENINPINIEGLYSVLVKDGQVLSNNVSDYTEEIEQYAIKVSDRNDDRGRDKNKNYRINTS